jgi:hypothetical protein
MMRRRDFLQWLMAIPLAPLVPPISEEKKMTALGKTSINVCDAAYGAQGDGVTDDAPAFNKAAAALKSRIQTLPGSPNNVCPGNILIPPGIYRLESSINLQNIEAYGWGIQASGAILYATCAGRTVLDCLGSAYGVFRDITIIGDSTSQPAIGLQIGRMTNNQMPAGGHQIENIKMNGFFTRTGIYNYAAEGCLYLNPTIHNQDATGNAHAIMIDGYHHYLPITDFQQTAFPQDTPDSCTQHTFDNTDISVKSGSPIWISNSSQVNFRPGCYAVSWNAPIVDVLVGTNCSDFNFDMHVEASATDYIRFSRLTPGNVDVFKLRIHDSGPMVKNLIRAGVNVNTLDVQYLDLWYLNFTGTIKQGNVVFYNKQVLNVIQTGISRS